MKKVLVSLWGGVGAALLFLFASCNNDLSENIKTAAANGEYGSVVVSGADSDSARALDIQSLKFASVFVSGEGISSGSEPSAKNISIKDGAGSFSIEKIPVGKNRIVTVQALDSSKSEIFGVTMRALCDVKPGKTENVPVNWKTTALGNVFYELNNLGYKVSGISDSEKTVIQNVIKTDVHACLIDCAKIASDFIKLKNGEISSLQSAYSYVNPAATLSFSYSDFSYKVQVCDPASKVAECSASSGLLENIAPGTWTVLLFDDDGNVIQKKENVVFDAGETVKIEFESPFDGIRIFVAKSIGYNQIYAWEGSDTALCGDYPGSKMDGNGDDYVTEFAGKSSLKFIINKGSGDANKLTGDIEIKEKGDYRVDSNGKCTKITGGSGSVTGPELKAIISVSGSTVVGNELTFSAVSSTGDISSYLWTFADGSTSSEIEVKKTYFVAGNYPLTLTVSDSKGKTNSASRTVNVVKPGEFVHRDFREENVYFLMTDRFSDGDKTNNNIWGDEYLPNGEADLYKFDESKTGVLSYYHGGDFKGIINNLDYIADMGFTAIWITPSVKQPEGRFYNGGDYEASAFHGYWGYDFDQIDPHLHSSGKNSDGWDDYKAFIDACHARGIRVMQDIVINHGNHTSAASPTKWVNYSVQTIMDGKEWAWKTLDPYYESDTSKNGFYSYYGFGQCSDLIDFGHLGEDGKDSRQHLINVYKKFIDAGVDAFRIDTIAYIPSEFAGEFADAMYNYAKSKGNDYFYMIGEAWCGRHDAVDRHAHDTTDSLHMLDMHLSCLDYPGQMQGVFKDGGDFSQYYNATSDDKQFACMTPEEYTKTAMFVDNHDCYRNEAIYSEAQYKNALNYIYIFRGVPIVFYGTEAMYSWSGTHPCTNKDDVVSRWMLGDEGINYVKTNKPPMYKHLKVLNEIRSSSPCIQKGEQEDLVLKGNQATFTRTYNGKTSYVGLNTGSSAYSYDFSVKSGVYTLVSCKSDGTYERSTITASGTYSLSVPANGFAFIEEN